MQFVYFLGDVSRRRLIVDRTFIADDLERSKNRRF